MESPNLRSGANRVWGSDLTDMSDLESGVMVELWSPNILLPTQTNRVGVPRGCLDLIEAVLEDALHLLSLPACPAREEAHRWIESGVRGYLKFNDVCEFLGLNAVLVRERALAGLVRPIKRTLIRSATTRNRAEKSAIRSRRWRAERELSESVRTSLQEPPCQPDHLAE